MDKAAEAGPATELENADAKIAVENDNPQPPPTSDDQVKEPSASALDGDTDNDDDDGIGEISDDDDAAVGDISDDDTPETTKEDDTSTWVKDVAAVREDPKNRTTAGVFESDDEDIGAESEQVVMDEYVPPPKVEVKRELHMPRHTFNEATLLKMPNFLSIESDPFHPETYEEVHEDDVTGNLDELGRNRVKLSVDNTIRWRFAADEHGNYLMGDDGEPKMESNAKLVKWSDGSETLVLGDTSIGVVRKDISSEHNVLLLQHSDTDLEVLSLMNKKISLKPISTTSKFHQRLTKTAAMAAEKKRQKMEVLKGVISDDPEKKLKDLEKSKSAAIQASRRREEQQYAERSRQARSQPMNRDFLEADVFDGGFSADAVDSESDEQDEEYVDVAEKSSKRHIFDDDDDDDAVESTEADSNAKSQEARKRRKVEDSDSDD